MSAVVVPLARSPVELLLLSDQLTEWARSLDEQRQNGHRIAIACTPDRRTAATRLGRRFGAAPFPVAALDRLADQLMRDDILLLLTSPVSRIHDAPCLEGTPLAALHSLLRTGTLVWGITGPRPNSISVHCHDSVALPLDDPAVLLESHERVVDALIALRPPITR